MMIQETLIWTKALTKTIQIEMFGLMKHEDNKHSIATIYGSSVFFKPYWEFS